MSTIFVSTRNRLQLCNAYQALSCIVVCTIMVDGLVQDLAGISNLMEAQEKAGLHKDEVLQSLFRTWSARLMNQPLKLSVLERQQLTAAITACPWSAEQCKSLAEIVLTSGSKQLAASNIKTTQKCFNFENFIPTDTVLKLKARTFTKVKANDDDYVMQEVAKFSVVSRLSFIATAARQVCIVNLDECTLNTVQTFIKAPGPKLSSLRPTRPPLNFFQQKSARLPFQTALYRQKLLCLNSKPSWQTSRCAVGAKACKNQSSIVRMRLSIVRCRHLLVRRGLSIAPCHHLRLFA